MVVEVGTLLASHALHHHHRHGHLLHEHEGVHHHQLLPLLGVLVRAVHAGAPVRKLAHYFRVHEQTLLALVALREELAFFRRVHVLALLRRLVAVREVTAPRVLLLKTARRRVRLLFTVLLLMRLGWLALLLLAQVARVHRPKPLESLLAQLFRFVFADFGRLVSHFWRRLPGVLFVVGLLIVMTAAIIVVVRTINSFAFELSRVPISLYQGV